MRLIFILLFSFSIIIPTTAKAVEDEVYLLVNKSQHKLSVILNDSVIYSFPIATGKTNEATPEGIYTIIRKVKNPWYIPKNIPGGDPTNPIGTRWIGLNVPKTNGYTYGIHGTNNPDSIGKNVSQGCIRMRNSDVEWLYRHIPLETKVEIRP
jgi:lipoprotein-anchoring transpeptidase ErfK/SrfK